MEECKRAGMPNTPAAAIRGENSQTLLLVPDRKLANTAARF